MNLRALVAAAALGAGLLAAPPASAATPSPYTCNGALSGALVPANPGGLVATAAVAVASGQVVCDKDVLTTPPIEHLATYGGHISIEILASNFSVICGRGPAVFSSAGSVLVMAITVECVMPVTDARRLGQLYAQLHWATLPPYQCCVSIRVPLSPVGATTY